MYSMFKTASKLSQQSSLKFAKRSFLTHTPRVSSMGSVTSSFEHIPVDTFVGDITFNEDIAIEKIHEKAIAADSMHAAANFGDHRVVPAASSSYQTIHIVGH
ncbi:hypothetical protein LPJ66_006779 [Kickxella alabastrina]|uniref:Uncharacterized protein n=1 Tax=Kickxella alabastrina TaxID=61397 RepID=A0ACC1IAR0_9FUNG|nr:hypothetical protein LPJ66_006779 [Kickxella alabastrina]